MNRRKTGTDYFLKWDKYSVGKQYDGKYVFETGNGSYLSKGEVLEGIKQLGIPSKEVVILKEENFIETTEIDIKEIEKKGFSRYER